MLAEISIIPVGDGVSVSSHIAKAAKIIDESGCDYRINPMATVVEGEMDEILDLIRKCHKAVMADVERVLITVVMDDRKDRKAPRLERKIESVEKKVGKVLRK